MDSECESGKRSITVRLICSNIFFNVNNAFIEENDSCSTMLDAESFLVCDDEKKTYLLP